MTPTPTVVTVAAHFPGEDLAIELVRLFGKLIDGQTPAQKAEIWGQWIAFWQPLVSMITKRGS